MARIRTIKPEFWTSEQVVECSPLARLLFIGLMNFCDDHGVHPASAKRLKLEVFPSDDIQISDVSKLIGELILFGLVAEFSDSGETYWCVTGWKHQKIRFPTYKYPAPPEHIPKRFGSPTVALQQGRELNLIELSRDELSRETPTESLSSEDDDAPLGEERKFFRDWNTIPGVQQISKITNKRRTAFRSRAREPDWDWCAAFAKFPLKCFQDGKWTPHIDWFLKPDTVTAILEGKYDWSKTDGRHVSRLAGGAGQNYDPGFVGDDKL